MLVEGCVARNHTLHDAALASDLCIWWLQIVVSVPWITGLAVTQEHDSHVCSDSDAFDVSHDSACRRSAVLESHEAMLQPVKAASGQSSEQNCAASPRDWRRFKQWHTDV